MTVEPPPPVVLPPPDPIKTRQVTWSVLDNGSVCLAPEEYGDLSYNMSEILRWMEDAGHQLNFYAMPKAKPPPNE